jgi:hypothetical protein
MMSQHHMRLLTTTLAGCLVVIMVVRGVPAWRDWYARELEDARETLQDARHVETRLAALPSLMDSLEARTDRLQQLMPWILPGDSPAEAAAMLSEMISSLSDLNQLDLSGLQVTMDTTSSHAFGDVVARFTVVGTFGRVLRLLAEVEAGTLLLSVAGLTITPAGHAEPAAASVRAEVTVSGLSLRGRL